MRKDPQCAFWYCLHHFLTLPAGSPLRRFYRSVGLCVSVERCLCLERARRSRSVMSARAVPGKRGAGGPGSVLCAGGEGGKRTRLSACRCPMSLSFPSCPDLSLSFSGRAGHHTHTPQRGATGARRLKRAKADGFGDAAGTARPALGGAGGCCLLSGRAGAVSRLAQTGLQRVVRQSTTRNEELPPSLPDSGAGPQATRASTRAPTEYAAGSPLPGLPSEPVSHGERVPPMSSACP